MQKVALFLTLQCDERGKSALVLLNSQINFHRVEIFDYLLSLDDIDVDFRDRLGHTPLLYLADVCFDEYFALELIKKGADVSLTEDSGCNFLHLAAKVNDDNLRVGHLVIKKGVDVNQKAHHGLTALFIACDQGNLDWVSMLLYYGADPTIITDRGILPIAMIANTSVYQYIQLEEILFNYTFEDGEKVPLRLPTLTAAMIPNTDLFVKLSERISYVDYNLSDLQHFVTSLIYLHSPNLQLFAKKFGYIIKEITENFPVLEILIKIALDGDIIGVRKIIEIFLDSEYFVKFIQSSNPYLPTIAKLLEEYTEDEEEEFTKIACFMLSYGLGVTSTDLDAVYHLFGYCKLFKILLHMEITIINTKNGVRSLAALYYNPELSVECFLETCYLLPNLLHYYNHPKLKENYFLTPNLIDEKLKLPQVPYLTELSRNAARKYILNKFNATSSAHFYTILNWLPIGKKNQRILAFEEQIY